MVAQLTNGQRIDYLVCDETQFYSAEQVDQLARIVDELQIDVFAMGLLTDFQTRLFAGSQRLWNCATGSRLFRSGRCAGVVSGRRIMPAPSTERWCLWVIRFGG